MKVEVSADLPNEVMKILKNGVASETSIGEIHKKEEKDSDKKIVIEEAIFTVEPTFPREVGVEVEGKGREEKYLNQDQNKQKEGEKTKLSNEKNFTCMICIDDIPESEGVSLSCNEHQLCVTCTQEYIKSQILSNGKVDIVCPQQKCNISLKNDIIRKYTDKETYEKFERFSLKKFLRTEKDCHFCPDPNCDYAVIIKRNKIFGRPIGSCSKDESKIDCKRPQCNTSFCFHCGEKWHPGTTCEQNKTLLKVSDGELVHQEHTKPCPNCNVPIFKMQDGTCNHMVCSSCGTHFCWLCMKEINEMHYFSPSGCSFHADEPLSFGKKVLLQSGLFLTAPIIIGLAAAVSVPAVMISIPWKTAKNVGKWTSKRNRTLGYSLLVPLSILASPFAAGAVIAIGVPTLVVTAYGIIPGYLIHEAIKNQRIQSQRKAKRLITDKQQQQTTVTVE